MTAIDWHLRSEAPPEIRVVVVVQRLEYGIQLALYDRDETEKHPTYIVVLKPNALDAIDNLEAGQAFAFPAMRFADSQAWFTTGEMPPGWVKT